MQSVECTGLKKLDSDLKDLLDDMPELRRELHEELAGLLKQEVDGAIAAASGRIEAKAIAKAEKFIETVAKRLEVEA